MWRVTPENYSPYHTFRKGAIIIFTAQYTASSRKKRQIKMNSCSTEKKSNAVTRHFFPPPRIVSIACSRYEKDQKRKEGNRACKTRRMTGIKTTITAKRKGKGNSYRSFSFFLIFWECEVHGLILAKKWFSALFFLRTISLEIKE